MNKRSPHNFHIPVMGLAYTIDSPIKVARYGINSTISIIEDNLIEMMRKYYYQKYHEPYIPITPKEENYRTKRITDYLDLINKIVQEQMEKLRTSAFEVGSEISKYFEMLPEESSVKQLYKQMLQAAGENKEVLDKALRKEIVAGAIEVNIMTKVDRNKLDRNGKLIADGSDALSALKGYAESKLENSAVVFSAGMNPRLFNYIEKFEVFDAKAWGVFDKRVVIKVSDYRSALVQGKYLAKKGIWVSEFRIESGLNCGGHAFATEGMLLGPILEEFKNKKDELISALFELYQPALEAKGKHVYDKPHPVKITVQGGIGNYSEHLFLLDHYKLDSTGWGTPFLLCPEATTVDNGTLQLLSKAREEDVILSKSSPLGVRFNYLQQTSGEKERLERITKGSPGSPCTEKYLISNTEFTKEPICTASKKYQKLKIEQLKTSNLSSRDLQNQIADVYSKECLCVGLSNSAALQYEQAFVKKQKAVTICPGPNIAYFSRIVSLKEMVDHIYGRANVLEETFRPHMFIKELQLYMAYLKEQVNDAIGIDNKLVKYCSTFGKNLLDGINYYHTLFNSNDMCSSLKNCVEKNLTDARKEIEITLKKITTTQVA